MWYAWLCFFLYLPFVQFREPDSHKGPPWALTSLIIITSLISTWFLHHQERAYRYMLAIDHLVRPDGQLCMVETYRLISSEFMHGSYTHLLCNMWALFWLGPALENRIGMGAFLLVYFISGVAGSISTVFRYYYYRKFCTVGASGCISGVFAASAVMYPLVWALPGVWYIFYCYHSVGHERINHVAHLGGAMMGLAMGLFVLWTGNWTRQLNFW